MGKLKRACSKQGAMNSAYMQSVREVGRTAIGLLKTSLTPCHVSLDLTQISIIRISRVVNHQLHLIICQPLIFLLHIISCSSRATWGGSICRVHKRSLVIAHAAEPQRLTLHSNNNKTPPARANHPDTKPLPTTHYESNKRNTRPSKQE